MGLWFCQAKTYLVGVCLFVCFYLLYREKTGIFDLPVHSSKCLQQEGLAQAEARGLQLKLGLPPSGSQVAEPPLPASQEHQQAVRWEAGKVEREKH